MYQQNNIAAFRQSYGAGGKIFSIWVKPRKTRKNSNLQDHEAKSWHKSQTRSYSINLRLMKKYVNAYMFIFTLLNH